MPGAGRGMRTVARGGRKRPAAAAVLLLSLLFVLAAAGCQPGGTGRRAEKGSPAPDFTLRDLEGKDLTLSSLRGRVVLLEFWATWCPPCRESLPAMEKLYRKYRKEGMEVVAIAVRDDADEVRKLVAADGLSFRVFLDDEAVSRIYGISGIPALFMLDRKGVIRHQLEGYRPAVDEEIAARVEKLLSR